MEFFSPGGRKVLLNSFDECHITRGIVGSALNYGAHERELSFDLFFHDNLEDAEGGRSEWYYPRLSAPGAAGRGTIPIQALGTSRS